MWHVSSRSGVATLRTAVHFLLTYYVNAIDSGEVIHSVCAGGVNNCCKSGINSYF